MGAEALPAVACAFDDADARAVVALGDHAVRVRAAEDGVRQGGEEGSYYFLCFPAIRARMSALAFSSPGRLITAVHLPFLFRLSIMCRLSAVLIGVYRVRYCIVTSLQIDPFRVLYLLVVGRRVAPPRVAVIDQGRSVCVRCYRPVSPLPPGHTSTLPLQSMCRRGFSAES